VTLCEACGWEDAPPETKGRKAKQPDPYLIAERTKEGWVLREGVEPHE
jgi:hypothetical protein